MAEVVGIVGGTGKLGGALAARWARAGQSLFIGSRDAVRGAAAGAAIGCDGGSNLSAATAAAVVVVTVPFASQTETLTEIAAVCHGKLIVDTTVPLVPPRVMRAQLPPEGSAALRARRLLGSDVDLVAAFHNVAAHKLADPDWVPDCDVLVFGEQRSSRQRVIRLAEAAGLRGLHGGGLENSAAAEAMTSVLIFMNKFYAVDGAGVALTGDLNALDGA